jgi:UDP-GlcNAc:undecaprenyl-phosphate GlcNAc-1-phosphate transferase
MTGIIITIITAFIISLIIVWQVLTLSHRKSWYDKIDERKIHTGDVPRLGGIGFSLAFIVTSLASAFIARETHLEMRVIAVLIGLILLVTFGVQDDFHTLAPRQKLLVQFIAGILVIIPDYTFHHLFIFGDKFMAFTWLRFPLSFLWIVGLTNAINFIDGVDGLAGGISAIIALTYAVIFVSFAGISLSVVFCLCLVAAIGGFLVFNMPFPQAKIFMGDGGSQFLGFTLAVLPLLDQGNNRLEFPIPYAAALVIIPILDTISAIWRRLRDGRRIDSPDKSHIHHKLMILGFNAWGVDKVLYGLQIVLGILVFLAINFRRHLPTSLIFLGLAYFISIGFFAAIHYINRAKYLRAPHDEAGESAIDTAS